MYDMQLEQFRQIADVMMKGRNYMWVADPKPGAGPCVVMDQITKQRADELLSRYGGTIEEIK